jgi:hypothetical protein
VKSIGRDVIVYGKDGFPHPGGKSRAGDELVTTGRSCIPAGAKSLAPTRDFREAFQADCGFQPRAERFYFRFSEKCALFCLS